MKKNNTKLEFQMKMIDLLNPTDESELKHTHSEDELVIINQELEKINEKIN